MLRRISGYIRDGNLIEDGDRILVGVSGGADSVCLLHMLFTLYHHTDVGLFVVHVHHGIRDEEADRDEAFVKELCDSLGVGFSSYHYDVVSIAAAERLSEEEAGRKVRYETFARASITNRCNKVAIAHNKNDNAETILFNLFRGSAVAGLTGMKPMLMMETKAGSIMVIRPILSVTREEIENYLTEQNLCYQDDATNFGDAYMRNKIRNRVLTYAREQINSNVIDNITNASAHLYEAYNFIEKCMNERYRVIVREDEGIFEYDTEALEKEDIVIQRGIIRRILGLLAGKLKDIEAKHTEDVLSLGKKQVGKTIHLPYGIIALKQYYTIKLYCKKADGPDIPDGEPAEPLDVIIPGRTFHAHCGIYIESDVMNYEKNRPFPKNSCMKWFDYDKIENTLKLRTRETGDYLQINEQGGRKKLKDYFIDLKIPKEERDKLLLIADGHHILWIIGYDNRISEKYKISDKTKQILSMILINAKEKKDDR